MKPHRAAARVDAAPQNAGLRQGLCGDAELTGDALAKRVLVARLVEAQLELDFGRQGARHG